MEPQYQTPPTAEAVAVGLLAPIGLDGGGTAGQSVDRGSERQRGANFSKAASRPSSSLVQTETDRQPDVRSLLSHRPARAEFQPPACKAHGPGSGGAQWCRCRRLPGPALPLDLLV